MGKTFIIAEAGVNHNGNVEIALEMVREAKRSGADAVKFQTFRAEDLVTADAPKAAYQNEGDDASTQYEMLKRLELTEDAHKKIKDECDKVGIEFMSTPFSLPSARFLNELGMRTWKIPSGELTNLPLLEYVARHGHRVILSTGMATEEEIEATVTVLITSGLKKESLYLLHCTTAYPTPLDDVNLRAMNSLRKFDCAGVGYSDHTAGILVPVAAVAAGAEIIEKHFTLDRSLAGPDHKASLEPAELEQMIADIRRVELAMGSEEKRPVPSEKGNMAVARKSIVASRRIKRGDVFIADNLTTKRPGTGMSPMLWNKLIGKEARRDYAVDEQISEEELR